MCPLVAAMLLGGALGGRLEAAPIGVAPVAEESDLEKKVSALHRRAEQVTPGTSEARVLAGELAQVGEAFLKKGETGQAIELLEEAYGWDAENGLVLAELTLAYVRQENFDFARFYLHLAEEQSVRSPPEIYGILGEIYYSLNRLEDAVVAWEHYRRLGGAKPQALKRLAQALEELSLASGQRVLFGEDFTLYSDTAISRPTVEQIGKYLEGAYREQSVFFETKLPGPQIVILYAGRTYFSLVSVPDWVSGVFDGKIRVSLDPYIGATPQLQAVLSHELAHALIRHASGDRAPGWLHEGLAQWWEGERIPVKEIRGAFVGRAPYSLEEMEGNLSRKADRAAARANYVQALGLIEYLIQQHGLASLSCLVRNLGEGLALPDALRRETGLTPQQLLSNWRVWAKLGKG